MAFPHAVLSGAVWPAVNRPYLLFFGSGPIKAQLSVDKVGEFFSVYEAQLAAEQKERLDVGNWARVVSKESLLVVRTGTHEGPLSAFWWSWLDAMGNSVDGIKKFQGKDRPG